jgi:hypothetical protein
MAVPQNFGKPPFARAVFCYLEALLKWTEPGQQIAGAGESVASGLCSPKTVPAYCATKRMTSDNPARP